jgi:hypothetical protein
MFYDLLTPFLKQETKAAGLLETLVECTKFVHGTILQEVIIKMYITIKD